MYTYLIIMEELDNNIDYSVKEIKKSNKKVQQNEIIKIIDEKLKEIQEAKYDDSFDKLLTMQIFYDENYTKKQLTLISQYYSLSTRKKRKSDLIQDIFFDRTRRVLRSI